MSETQPVPSYFRFRLMLLLLIVALFASIFAWQRAVWDAKSLDRQRAIDNIETRIKASEIRGENTDWLREALERFKADPSMADPTDDL
jgi:hypothetical protein